MKRISIGTARTIVLATFGLAVLATQAGAIEIDYLLDDDPNLRPPDTVLDLNPKPVPLWIAALSAPERDVRREAAQTLALAHRMGMPEVEKAIPALRAALDDPQQSSAVVVAVAQALIEMDARDAAPSLAKRLPQGGWELAAVVEPALAQWDYAPQRKIWLARLDDAHVGRAFLLLAVESLAAVREGAAAPRLRTLTLDPNGQAGVRLAAAKAWGRIQTQDLEGPARELAAHESAAGRVDRLLAAWMLKGHDSPAATEILKDLALDAEPAVAGAALQSLVERDFRTALPLAERLAIHPDANVRHWIAKAWTAERTPASVAHLAPLLDDPHPEIRGHVRDAFLEMANDSALKDAVVQAAEGALAGKSWRGLEQATLICVALDRKNTAARLVELLDFDRPEVYIAAAWGLRRLGVPDTAEAILAKANRVQALQFGSRDPDLAPVNEQFRHLAEGLRVLEVADAVPLLRKYIPKSQTVDPLSRAAAIWCLGHLLVGKPEADDLVGPLCERLADAGGIMPEDGHVRAMCAITLGRWKAAGGLPTLRKFRGAELAAGPVEFACGWAIHHIAGDPLPVYLQNKVPRLGWFLEPSR